MRLPHRLLAYVALLAIASFAGAAPPGADPVAAARTAVAKSPEDVGAWLALADALLADGDDVGAATAVEDGLEVLPEAAPLWIKRGDLHLALGLRMARSGGDALFTAAVFHDAIRTYGQARKLDSKSADAVFGVAIATYYLNEPSSREGARVLAGECIVLDAKHARAWALKARILYELRRWAEAEEAYRRAVALDDSDVNRCLRIGHCHYARGQLDAAKAAYVDALRRHPKSGDPILGGLLHLAGKDWEKSLPVLREAAAAVPRSPAIHYYIGWCHFLAERWDDAARSLRKAMKIDSREVVYANLLGQTEEKRGDVDAAVGAYRRALKASPDHFDSANRFDRIARTRPEHEQTEKLYEELCTLAPTNPWIHNNYGYWLRSWAERQGRGTATRPNPPAIVRRRLKRAIEIYLVAAKYAPEAPQLQSDTGLAHEFYPVTRDHETASRFFRRAIELAGDALYRDALNGLMRIHARDEDWKELRRLATRVVDALEAGQSAIAPTGGPPVELSPVMRARFLSTAKRMLRLADEKLGADGDGK